MNTKYDDEIREVESRLVREREALLAKAEILGETARDAAVSPKGLLAAVAVGFLLGELTTPKRRGEKSQAAATTAKVGIGGLIGSALMSYARTQYGSPWALGRSAWNYAAAQRARRAAAAAAAAQTAASSAYSSPVRRQEPARAPSAAGTVQTVPPAGYSKRSPAPSTHPSHAAT
jgi:hypothetical protein